jgi:hypothetical protein
MGLRHNHLDTGPATFAPPGPHIPRHRHLAQTRIVFGAEPLTIGQCVAVYGSEEMTRI